MGRAMRGCELRLLHCWEVKLWWWGRVGSPGVAARIGLRGGDPEVVALVGPELGDFGQESGKSRDLELVGVSTRWAPAAAASPRPAAPVEAGWSPGARRRDNKCLSLGGEIISLLLLFLYLSKFL